VAEFSPPQLRSQRLNIFVRQPTRACKLLQIDVLDVPWWIVGSASLIKTRQAPGYTSERKDLVRPPRMKVLPPPSLEPESRQLADNSDARTHAIL